jgi:alkanesulfonate monooxygenase SsuD/methylene tetrahydromethanopterin reductase-like flavin-dependent oxidoreductase (luciferase family)
MEAFMKRLIGTPQQWIDKLNAFKVRGIEYFIIDFAEPTDFNQLRLFAQEVVPAVK